MITRRQQTTALYNTLCTIFSFWQKQSDLNERCDFWDDFAGHDIYMESELAKHEMSQNPYLGENYYYDKVDECIFYFTKMILEWLVDNN